MGRAPVVDAHLHIWDLERSAYAWLTPELGELYATFTPEQAQAELQAAGIGSKSTDALLAAVRTGALDLVMVAGRYTLLEQADEVVAACREAGVGIVAAAIFNSGLLSTPRPGGRYEYGAVPAETLGRAERIADVCERHGVTLPEAALQFPLREPAVRSVVAGAASPQQVRENARRMDVEIPETLWLDLARR